MTATTTNTTTVIDDHMMHSSKAAANHIRSKPKKLIISSNPFDEAFAEAEMLTAITVATANSIQPSNVSADNLHFELSCDHDGGECQGEDDEEPVGSVEIAVQLA